MSLQEDIIAQLGVKPVIDPQEEIRRSIEFLKDYLQKHQAPITPMPSRRVPSTVSKYSSARRPVQHHPHHRQG